MCVFVLPRVHFVATIHSTWHEAATQGLHGKEGVRLCAYQKLRKLAYALTFALLPMRVCICASCLCTNQCVCVCVCGGLNLWQYLA